MQIAAAIVPEMMTAALAFASGADPTETAVAVQPDFSGAHASRIYFIINGDRVKIGVTTNLKARLYSLSQPEESVAMTLAGDRALEAALHHRFEQFRVSGSEWFRLAPEITNYIADRSRLVVPIRPARSNRAVSDEDLIKALHRVADPNAYLADVAKDLDLPYREARRRVLSLGIFIRRAVRNGNTTGVGVHRDDLPQIPAA